MLHTARSVWLVMRGSTGRTQRRVLPGIAEGRESIAAGVVDATLTRSDGGWLITGLGESPTVATSDGWLVLLFAASARRSNAPDGLIVHRRRLAASAGTLLLARDDALTGAERALSASRPLVGAACLGASTGALRMAREYAEQLQRVDANGVVLERIAATQLILEDRVAHLTEMVCEECAANDATDPGADAVDRQRRLVAMAKETPREAQDVLTRLLLLGHRTAYPT